MAEVKQKETQTLCSLSEPHIKEEPESINIMETEESPFYLTNMETQFLQLKGEPVFPSIQEEPEEESELFPFHIIKVKTEDKQDQETDDDTDCSEDYYQEEAQGTKQSSSMIPPASGAINHRFYMCYVCGKKFLNSRGLQSHALLHTEDTSIKCSLCESCFTDKNHLSDHMKTHIISARPFHCSICGEGFIQESDLCLHQSRSHHMCPVCPQRFARKKSLSQHLELHVADGTLDPSSVQYREIVKPFGCSECNKYFRNRLELRRHMSCVQGEKPQQCLLCGKRFIVKGNLNDHMKTQSGEQAFICWVCGKGRGRFERLKKDAGSRQRETTGTKSKTRFRRRGDEQHQEKVRSSRRETAGSKTNSSC